MKKTDMVVGTVCKPVGGSNKVRRIIGLEDDKVLVEDVVGGSRRMLKRSTILGYVVIERPKTIERIWNEVVTKKPVKRKRLKSMFVCA